MMKSWIVYMAPLVIGCAAQDGPVQEPIAHSPPAVEAVLEVVVAAIDDSGSAAKEIPRPAVEVAAVSPPHTSDGALATERYVYQLRHGETLHHFAKWSDRTVEDVVSSSGIELREDYDAGTTLALHLTTEQCSRVEERRESHRVARASRYLEQRGGHSTTGFHTVASGESAWRIARQTIGIPVWLLESYNPSVDLDRLRPGQVLMFPKIAVEEETTSVDGLLALQ